MGSPSGDVTINATGTVSLDGSFITTEGGAIAVHARNLSLSGTSFMGVGRGGLPPSPNEPLQAETVNTPWVTLDSGTENKIPAISTKSRTSVPPTLVEAQGWIIDEQGQVILTASAPKVTPHGESPSDIECNVSQTQ